MHKLIKLLTIIIPVLIIIGLITGCTIIKDESLLNPNSGSTYFHRGVYKSYSANKKKPNKNHFYIFNNENSGHTEESEHGIGIPFSCIQTDGYVKFKFGGAKEPEEILKIESVKNEVIIGSFKNKPLLIFEFIPNSNPDNFDAVEYMKKHK